MRKPLVCALALALSLLGLMAGTPVLTQAPSSDQYCQHAPDTLALFESIPAAADASVHSEKPNTNYGSSGYLSLHYNPGPPTRASCFLIRFDLTSALPPGAIIDSAIMKAFTEYQGVHVWVTAYAATSNWSENSVTWNTRPSTASAGVGAQTTYMGGWLTWNATSFARAWQSDPAHNYGLEVRGPFSGSYYDLYFYGRGWYGGGGARLEVNYHLPPTTPTPTPTATPACWRLQGKVFDADYAGETQPLQGIDLKLVGSESSYPASGTQLGMETTNGDGWYGLWACDQPTTYDYYRIQLQMPAGWEAVNTMTMAGEVKGGKKVIQFAWPLEGRDLTGNKYWIRKIPGPAPTPTATPRPPEDCENILANGSFEGGIVEPWRTTGAARVNSQYKHDGTKSVLLVEANDQEGELIAGVDLPEGADSITLRYWWRVETQDPEPTSDLMSVLVEPSGATYEVGRHTGADGPGLWHLQEVDLDAYAGENTLILFQGRNGPEYPAKWYVDQVEVEVCGEGWGGYKLFVPLVMKGG